MNLYLPRRWDGSANGKCSMLDAQCSMLNAQCSMPNAQCPMLNEFSTLAKVRVFAAIRHDQRDLTVYAHELMQRLI
ncbi:MAG: hypothetical protein ACREH8_03500, partial [Opitutaceae bacterium]